MVTSYSLQHTDKWSHQNTHKWLTTSLSSSALSYIPYPRGSLGHHSWFRNQFSPYFAVLHCPMRLGELKACPFRDVVFSPLLCRPCLLSSSTVPCKMILDRPDEQETCPYHFGLRLFTIVRSSSCGPRREAGDVWCLPPVWNLRAVIWFHFAISSLVLLPSPVTLSVLSFSACWPFLLSFFQKILQYFSLIDRLFCMAPVQRLREDSWSVVCAACCHMTLVFAIMHLYNIF